MQAIQFSINQILSHFMNTTLVMIPGSPILIIEVTPLERGVLTSALALAPAVATLREPTTPVAIQMP